MPKEDTNASAGYDVVHKDIYQKYEALPAYVYKLESTTVAQIFKECKGPNTFYPHCGLFFHEFALGYCMNLSK